MSGVRSMPDIPDEIWDRIISLLTHDHHLEPLSLVSRTFLSITNRLKHSLSISQPTLHFLPKLFHRFPNLKHISLRHFPGSPDQVLGLIAHAHFALESLDLSNQKYFPAHAIRELPTSSLGSIKCLKLSKVSVLNDGDLGLIGELMGGLEELDLSEPVDDYNVTADLDITGGSLGITDDGVDLLAGKVGNLKRVDLSGNYLVSDKAVMSLSEKCVGLEEIVVKNCTFVSQTGVGFALKACENLRSVGLLGMELSPSEMSEPFACARNLSVLDFSYMDVSDEMLFAISRANIPLRKLTLFHCKEFSFVGVLSLLRSYSCLEYLALEGVYWLTDRSIIDLSKFLRRASTIKINFCSRLTSSAFFTLLKNCPSLRSLEMEKAGMGEEAFAVSNVYHPGIRDLILGANKILSNECLERIAVSCPNLELLDISDCPGIGRKGIGEIVRRCTNLRHLQMSGCQGIKSLGIDAKLQKLEELEASASGLDDEGLMVIAKKCPSLVKLDLKNCARITSKGVKEIVYRCTRLREINLHYCRDMGRDIVAWMVFSRPSLRKIIPPLGFVPTENEKSLFLLHGCYVSQP